VWVAVAVGMGMGVGVCVGVCGCGGVGCIHKYIHTHTHTHRYVLRERMGEGGLGAQWYAVDSISDQDVVLVEEGDETALAVRDAILGERGQGEESERRRWREERFLREMQVCVCLCLCLCACVPVCL
jgi:hypothetical protein